MLIRHGIDAVVEAGEGGEGGELGGAVPHGHAGMLHRIGLRVLQVDDI